MKTYIYPGSFCPPTFGHLEIVKNASSFVEKLIVICSTNPDKKDNWFSVEEAKEMWDSYELPQNVDIITLEEFKRKKVNPQNIIMVRGIRNKSDLEYEREITLYNKEHFGITKYMYIFSENKYESVSSTKVRSLSENLEITKLSKYVSPLIISRLLEKVLKLDNLFMVVGRPGCGKSTILNIIKQYDEHAEFINTDDFNKELKHILEEQFDTKDLIKIAVENEALLKKAIAKPWLDLLRRSLEYTPSLCKNLFVEVPYGLQEDKRIFRFLGGKILCIYCDKEKSIARIRQRGNTEIIPFIDRIPDIQNSTAICHKNKLMMISIKTDCDISVLKQTIERFYLDLKREEKWKTFLQKSC